MADGIAQNLETIRLTLALLESKLDSVHKLSEKSRDDLNATKHSLQETVSSISLINRELKSVADNCNSLNKLVVVGNGTPSIKESLALLQSWRTETTKAIEELREGQEEIHEELKSSLRELAADEKEDGKEAKRNRFETVIQSVGWVVVIIGVLLEALLNKIWK